MTNAGAAPLVGPEELAGRLLEAAVGAMDVFSLYLGEKLGFYRALHEGGPATSTELASRTGTNERYVREWLEQQATTGFLAFDEAAPRRYSLPAGYEAVLVDPESEAFVAPVGRFLTSTVAQAPKLLEVFRKGGGIDWQDYGEDMLTAQADFNRPFYMNALVPSYLSQVPAIDERLGAIGAKVAVVGVGGGWEAIAIARGYPAAHVDGFDIDAPSVDLARAHVSTAGLSSRVDIQLRDAGDPAIAGQYDLVAAFECIHDMSNPVAALATMRRLANPGGTVLVMDERVGETFGAVGDLVERMYYGFSLGVCLPAGMADEPSAATGTVMRPGVLRDYAKQAGFADIEVLPLEHDLYRFYRMVP